MTDHFDELALKLVRETVDVGIENVIRSQQAVRGLVIDAVTDAVATALRSAVEAEREHSGAWPCDGIGDERGNFVCKKDLQLGEAKKIIQGLLGFPFSESWIERARRFIENKS